MAKRNHGEDHIKWSAHDQKATIHCENCGETEIITLPKVGLLARKLNAFVAVHKVCKKKEVEDVRN